MTGISLRSFIRVSVMGLSGSSFSTNRSTRCLPRKPSSRTRKLLLRPSPPRPLPRLSARRWQPPTTTSTTHFCAPPLLLTRQANAKARREIYKRAEKYDAEYRKNERDLIRNRRIAKNSGMYWLSRPRPNALIVLPPSSHARFSRSAGVFYVDPEPKIALVVRIRGINAVDPRTKKILQLLRLRQSTRSLSCHQLFFLARSLHDFALTHGLSPQRCLRPPLQAHEADAHPRDPLHHLGIPHP